jgi:hypothetical protein
MTEAAMYHGAMRSRLDFPLKPTTARVNVESSSRRDLAELLRPNTKTQG